MTKGEIVELLQRHLAGGEVPADIRGKYHENVCARYLEIAYDAAVGEERRVSQAKRESSETDKFLKSYIINGDAVKCNEVTKEFYIELPEEAPSSPSGNDIMYFGSAAKGSRGWIYRHQAAHDVFNELDVNLVDQSPRYSIEGDKFYFYNVLDTNIPENFSVRMVAGFDDYEDDDEIPMPEGQEAKIFTMVIQIMMTMGREELINDNEIQAEATMRRTK